MMMPLDASKKPPRCFKLRRRRRHASVLMLLLKKREPTMLIYAEATRIISRMGDGPAVKKRHALARLILRSAHEYHVSALRSHASSQRR